MKVLMGACLIILLLSSATAQTLMPDQTRYIAPDDTRKFDSTEYTAQASFEDRIKLAETWPKINGISFDREKNFTITGPTIKNRTNGIYIDTVDLNGLLLSIDFNTLGDLRYFTRDTNQTGNGDKNFTGTVNFRKVPSMNTPGTVTLAVNPPSTLGSSPFVGLQWWGVNNAEKAFLDMLGGLSVQSLTAVSDILANRIISPMYFVTDIQSYELGTMQISGFNMDPMWWTTYDGDPDVYLAPAGTVQTPNIFLSDSSSQIVFGASGIGSMTLKGDGVDRDQTIIFPNDTGTLATIENPQTFSASNTFSATNDFSATQNYTNATLGIDITNTSPLLKFTDTTATTDDWQIGGSTNNTLTIRNTTDSRNDLNISQDGNTTIANKTTIRPDGNFYMTSPNGTRWNCGIINAGTLQCT